MSPSKKGGDYFHATLNDGVKARLVGFQKRQRDLLQEFNASGETVDIAACKVEINKEKLATTIHFFSYHLNYIINLQVKLTPYNMYLAHARPKHVHATSIVRFFTICTFVAFCRLGFACS